jgi:hypothetical protein
VYLVDEPLGDPFNPVERKMVTIQKLPNDRPGSIYGSLVAEVIATRKSTHIGDLFRGIFPSTPKLGARIVLGHGALFYNGNQVGLKPDDGRENDWLDPHSLYQAHDQTVRLIFVPD